MGGRKQGVEEVFKEMVDREGMLSYERLTQQINRNHPKKMDPEIEEYRNWSLCQNVGSLFANACFSKKKVTPFLMNIGIGPGLFLMSLQAFLRLFLVISILAIPSCMLLASGN